MQSLPLESSVGPTFRSLLERLRKRVSEQLAAGEWTERGLARRAGISQPHLHNVLKGIRSMTPEVADRLLTTLQMSVDDLRGNAR